MRKLAEAAVVKALETITGRARVKRTMWSRRAQEYEAKINSGDLIAIAEVVRDLFRSDAQPEQSYSERQLYEAALDRMAREIAAVNRITETEALKQIDGASPSRRSGARHRGRAAKAMPKATTCRKRRPEARRPGRTFPVPSIIDRARCASAGLFLWAAAPPKACRPDPSGNTRSRNRARCGNRASPALLHRRGTIAFTFPLSGALRGIPDHPVSSGATRSGAATSKKS